MVGWEAVSPAPALTWVGPSVLCKGPAPAVGAHLAALLSCGEPRFCTRGPLFQTASCLMLQTEAFAALGGGQRS